MIDVLLQQVLVIWIVVNDPTMKELKGSVEALLDGDELTSVVGGCD